MRRVSGWALSAVAIGFVPGIAFADGGPGSSVKDPVVAQYFPGITVSAGLGVVNGSANELVYNPANGALISKLRWTYDNNAVVNLGVDVALAKWLNIGVKAALGLSDPSTMDDYDYNTAGCPNNFCHSHHENTQLRSYTAVDAYAKATFWSHGNFAFAGLAGYKSTASHWTALGGVANYGVLPPGPGIRYRQWWDAPYLGLEATARYGKFTFSTALKGSAWTQSHDRDEHLLRNPPRVFTERFKSEDMYAVSAQVGYNYSERLMLTFDFEHVAWGLTKGPTDFFDNGVRTHIGGDAAGASSITQTYSLGLKYKM